MRLSEIIKGLDKTCMKGSSQVEIHSLTSDLWKVRPGSMYFVPQESRTYFDVELAMERGAVAIVTETDFVPNPRATMIQVPNRFAAMAQCACNFHGNPSHHLPVVGVTGPAWPEKFSPILKQVFSHAGIPTGLIGSAQVEAGERLLPGLPHLGDPLEIQQILADMRRAGCKACVMEIAGDHLPTARKLGVTFHAVIASLLPDGAEAKNPIDWLEKLPPAEKQVVAIYPSTQTTTSGGEMEMTLINQGEKVSVKGSDLAFSSTRSSFYLHLGGSVAHCESKLVGRTNVAHLLAAAGMASILKVRPALVAGALRKVKKIPGNLHRITAQAPFDLFVDSTRTPLALLHLTRDLKEFAQGRIITVLGASGKTSPGFRRLLGAAAAKNSDFIVLTSDNPGHEEAEEICAQIAGGFDAETNHAIILPREAAINFALREAKPKDIVLIAGKGDKSSQELESTIVPFDDFVRAKEALNEVRHARNQDLPRSKRQQLETK